MSFFAKLAVLFTVDSSEVKVGVEKSIAEMRRMQTAARKAEREAQKSWDSLVSGARTAAAGIAIATAAILKLAQTADELQDKADAFDTTVSSILELEAAMISSGSEAGKLTNALSKLASSADDAKQGGEKAREAFARLGITGKEVESLKPDELYRKVAIALSEVESTTDRAALAQDLLGKAAKGIAWDKQAQAIRENIGVYDDAGKSVKEWADAWDTLVIAGKKTVLFLLEILKPIAALINYISTAKKLQKELKEQGGSVTFTNEFGLEETRNYDPDPAAVAAKEEQNKKADKALKALSKPGGYSAATDKEKAEKSAIKAAQEAAIIQAKLFETEKMRIQLASDRVFMSEREIKLAEEVFASTDRISKLELERGKIEAKVTYGNEKAVKSKMLEIDNINKQIGYEQELSDRRKASIELEYQRQSSFEFGWDQAYRKLIDNNDKLANRAQAVFATLEGGFDQVLDAITGKSKKSFADIAGSIIQDLIKIQLKAQAISLLKGVGGASGVGGFLGSIFGGGGAPNPATLPGYSLFAEGGMVMPNSGDFVVGEKGPELLSIGSNSGSVTANDKLGGGPVNNYYGPVITNLNAIDTQTGIDFIIRNKEAVYMANQSASRGFSLSR